MLNVVKQSCYIKLFHRGDTTVGIRVRHHQDKVLDVCRSSDRVMAVNLVLSDNVWTIVSPYAPRVGCDEDTNRIHTNSGMGWNH